MKKRMISMLAVVVLLLSIFAVPVMADTSVTLELGVYDNVFDLENKDTNWVPITGDGIGAQFGYNTSASDFQFGLIAEGLATDTPYSLIYYADTEDRFVDWGGVIGDAGMVIATGTSDSSGNLVLSGSPDLGQNLPSLPDANAYFYDYTLTPDFYDDATGAKVWLIPTDELSTGDVMPVATWGKDNSWLFETQLVNYDDTDIAPESMVAITVTPANLDFGLTTPLTSVSEDLTVTNTGFVSVNVSATATGAIASQGLTLDSDAVSIWGITGLATDTPTTVVVGITPTASGVMTGLLTFTAIATP